MKKFNYTILFSLSYILGIISFFTSTTIYLAGGVFVALIFLIYKNFISNKSAIVFYLAFVLALLNCNFQIKNYDALSSFVPSKGVLKGYVETIPTTNNKNKTKFYFKVKNAELIKYGEESKQNVFDIDARTIVTIYDTPQNISKIKVFDELELRGKLFQPIQAKNPSQFDYSKYLKNHKTFSTFYVTTGDWEIVSAPRTIGGKFLQKLNDKRCHILNIHKQFLKSPNLEVLGGIVFGDDAINPPEYIKDSFINSGLLHILAASGMNVSIIFGLWFFLGTRMRLNYRLVIFIGAVLVAFYTLMTGMGPSVLRAALMIEFVLLGKLIDRNTDSIALIFFVAFLMLLYDPAMINDVGFQLSFIVTFALMFYCPPLLEKIENKFLEFIAGAILIPIVAQLFAAPIQMFYFNTFATYSIFANFLIAPFIMVISFMGFLGSIIAMIPIDIIAVKTCYLIDFILNPFITALVKISDSFSGLPFSLLNTMHPSCLQLILYYGVLIGFGFAIRDEFKNKKFILAILCMSIVFCFSLIKIDHNDCEILVFDVGNADSFLIKTPQKRYIMIDTGHGYFDNKINGFSQANYIMGKYFKDNGIKNLDILVLTHFDSDHSGGAVDIMESTNVKKIVLNKYIDNSKTTKHILNYVIKNKVPAIYPENKQVLYKEDDLSLKAFTPNFINNKSDNDNSTIVLLSYGDFDMLFMADAGVRSFDKVKADIDNQKIEILKIGHHGARNTVTTKMLKSINPTAAVVSTGYNTYGHPAKETLHTVSKNNVKIYRTDTNNAIKIVSTKKDYQIYKYNAEKKKFEKDFHNLCNKP